MIYAFSISDLRVLVSPLLNRSCTLELTCELVEVNSEDDIAGEVEQVRSIDALPAALNDLILRIKSPMLRQCHATEHGILNLTRPRAHTHTHMGPLGFLSKTVSTCNIK